MEQEEPVIITGILMSDHAIREAGTNKLSLIGIFSQWNANAFPFQTTPFYVTAFVTNFRAMDNPHDLAVRIEKVGSRVVIFSLGAKFGFGGVLTKSAVMDLSLPAPQGILIPEAGLYRIDVLIDGEEIANRNFEVNPISANPIKSQ